MQACGKLEYRGIVSSFANTLILGVVVANVAEQYSHWTAVESLGEWCAREGVPAITGVDTRMISNDCIELP